MPNYVFMSQRPGGQMGRPAIVLHPGERFGRLVVLERAPPNPNNAMWRVRCDCGAITAAPGPSLRSGKTRSCGCMRGDSARRLNARRWGADSGTRAAP